MIMNIIERAIREHKSLISLMEEIAIGIHENHDQMYTQQFIQLFLQFEQQFYRHDELEKVLLYGQFQQIPILIRRIRTVNEAHHVVMNGIEELKALHFETECWGAKFLILREILLLAIKMEETEIFPVALEILQPRLNQVA